MNSWLYQIATHSFTDPRTGEVFSEDIYSGAFGLWQNNPDCCGDVDQGPIPPGNWRITGLVDDAETGPNTLVLAPADVDTLSSVKALGRDPFSFRIHGERIPPAVPGYASEGCIIAPPGVRVERIWNSGLKTLKVE
jgi:hypothetical protein